MEGAGTGVYGSSKSAVDGITRVASVELAGKGIKGELLGAESHLFLISGCFLVYSINVFQSEMSSRGSEAMMGSDDAAPLAAAFNPSGKVGKGEDIARLLLELLQGKQA